MAGFGSNPLSPPSGHAAPDAIAFIVLDGPFETIMPNRTEGTDRHTTDASVRARRKPQIRVVAETQCGLSPRSRVLVRLVTQWSEVWRKQKGTQFVTPSISSASPGSGAMKR
jgi:hypothetical protein